MNKGLFISIEGGEGAGKTTVIEHLKDMMIHLTDRSVLVTREPGGGVISEKIRDVLLGDGSEKMDLKTEALLYAAARRQHVVELIKPALDKGHVVITDRYVDTSYVYQGFVKGMHLWDVMKINDIATDELMPDRTFYLDIDPEVGLKRIASNNDREVNRFDKESLEFHKVVRRSYRNMHALYSDRIKMIDANKSVEEVKEQLTNNLMNWSVLRND